MRKIAFIALLFVLCACAAHGREVRQDQLAQLKKGETTVDQTIALLGKPTMRTTMGTGQTMLSYSYARVQSRPETFIPIIGGFVGGADTYTSYVRLTYGADGVLQNFVASEGGSGTGLCVASGSVRDRQPGPVEAK